MSSHQPPKHLRSETRAWWREVVASYVLDSHHVKLLQACAEAWDRAEQARKVIDRKGLIYTDRFGQPKAHPAVDIERRSLAEFRLHLRELGLDVAPPSEARAPAAPANRDRLRIAR